VSLPEQFLVDDSMIIPPAAAPSTVEIRYGPSIKPVPQQQALGEILEGEILLKVGDNISTDEIMPAGAEILPLRSNIPAISEHVFARVDETFSGRVRQCGGGIVLAGDNYGQGSSREHAALAPAYLGIKAILATSFARIHRGNLINFGIVPIEISPQDYDRCQQSDKLRLADIHRGLQKEGQLTIENVTGGFSFTGNCELAERQAQVLLAGGALNWAKQKLKGEEQ